MDGRGDLAELMRADLPHVIVQRVERCTDGPVLSAASLLRASRAASRDADLTYTHISICP